MNRVAIATSLIVGGLAALVGNTVPACAQGAEALPAARPATTQTRPPGGFTRAIVLWPEGAPGAQGTTDGDIPKLFTYPVQAMIAGDGSRPAVIVMPGGGYTHEVMEQEGAYEAKWLVAHGVAAFVLEYRLAPAYLYPAQMQDASRAIRYVRAHAAELGVKPDAIGVWGFSAGGTLAGYMATVHTPGDAGAKDAIDRASDRPDFAIISYGRLDMHVPLATGAMPMESILPEKTQAAVDAIDPVKHVSADTSPCFIYSTTGDKTVDARNSAEFYIALKAAGVPAELHIFELGAHGTHMGDDHASPQELKVNPTLVADWMKLHDWMPEEEQ